MTYTNILEMMETPGTHLHDGWREMPAPEIAKTYWRLDDDATMYEVLQQVAVDETNHRDVNHTFADMASDDPNPFVLQHQEDAARAWKINEAEKLLREHRSGGVGLGKDASL